MRLILIVTFLLFGVTSFSQDFDLDIAATNETCDDNGTITFTVNNPPAGATYLFTVFKQPDLVNPVEVTSAFLVTNLDSGTYSITAEQLVGGNATVVEEEVTIQNQIEPLTYSINAVSQNCAGGGQVEITTLTGTAATYEIIGGPEIRPLQTSNIFEGLPAGVYNFRVFDDCGQGVVTTYTLILASATPTVGMPEYEEIITTGCNSVIITNTVSYPEGAAFSYPLTITYTIHPPNGAPDETETFVINEGDSNQLELTHQFDISNGEVYTYDIQIVNSCGNQYGNTGMTVDPQPLVAHILTETGCGQYYLTVNVTNFSPPFTVNIQSTAPGFDPGSYNAQHPGPFSESVILYGSETLPVPEGTYDVTITDACNRTASEQFEVVNNAPTPVATGRNNGCYSDLGRISATVPSRDIISAEILNGPPEYVSGNPDPLPHDVSSFINSGGRLTVTNLPVGDYVIRITDECGQTYDLPVNIPEFVERDFAGSSLADCNIGLGSLEISSGNGALTEITLTDAPSEYEGEVPENFSSLIDPTSGDLFLDSLPEGEYTFSGTDVCGIQRTITIDVIGYQPADNTFTFDPHCGSFDIIMFDTDNTSTSPTYWLQVLDLDTGEWVHPETGVPYPEGTIPTEDNSYPLPNGTTTFNLTFTGDFRIVKAFESYGNANETKNCIIELGTFNYLNQPRINNLYKLSCAGTPDDVFIDADGIAPLEYTVVDPADPSVVIIDNGNDSVFSNLPAGTYTFRVEDGCGNRQIKTQNITVLPDLVIANQPDDLFECVEPGEEFSHEFDLSVQTPVILGDQPDISYSLTYHLTEVDAENGTNPIDDLYLLTDSSVTIYARVIRNNILICQEVVSFTLNIGETPTLDMQQNYYLCEDSFVYIHAGNGYDSYQWSNGETSSFIIATEPGTYSVTVNQGGCTATEEVIVDISEPAEGIEVEIEDWTYDHNNIYVTVTGEGIYEYSIDGDNFQEESYFTGLESGIYTVYVRDINGCGVEEAEVALLNYPKFFTPNKDGINETWRIPFSWFEEGLTVVVFDRYGKVITSFDAEAPGWDGTYNGHNLPSTDYWFLVTRQDGRVHKGHFSLVR